MNLWTTVTLALSRLAAARTRASLALAGFSTPLRPLRVHRRGYAPAVLSPVERPRSAGRKTKKNAETQSRKEVRGERNTRENEISSYSARLSFLCVSAFNPVPALPHA